MLQEDKREAWEEAENDSLDGTVPSMATRILQLAG
jgi:hypothetical protein